VGMCPLNLVVQGFGALRWDNSLGFEETYCLSRKILGPAVSDQSAGCAGQRSHKHWYPTGCWWCLDLEPQWFRSFRCRAEPLSSCAIRRHGTRQSQAAVFVADSIKL